ncbi:hypothetical protein FXO37_10355 [Capsicum annuum]|nr:hypothetical protein FXO37_10355 [Capsicum annuum]
MAESRRYGLNAQLDIEQILLEAQHRWLRPAEVCEILRNYQKFRIAPEPPNRPPSGSLFLFDRKVLRYFRKDGHSWRKKKDGKTVKEAHERLKEADQELIFLQAGSIDVLHCYYAHGEENENFQRRSYWMLEEEMSHIVLVHYREVKGNRTNFSRIKEPQQVTPDFQETDEDVRSSEVDSSASTKFYPNDYQVNSQVTDTTSLSSVQASEYEDAESVYNQHPTSGFHSFLDAQPSAGDGLAVPYRPIPFSTDDHQVQFAGSSGMSFSSIPPGNRNGNTANSYIPSRNLDFPSWETLSVNSPAAFESLHFQSSGQPGANNLMHEQGNTTMGEMFLNDFKRQEQENRIDGLGNWQIAYGTHGELPLLEIFLCQYCFSCQKPGETGHLERGFRFPNLLPRPRKWEDRIYYYACFKSFEIAKTASKFEIWFEWTEHSRNLMRKVTLSLKVMKWLVHLFNDASKEQRMSTKRWKTRDLFAEFYNLRYNEHACHEIPTLNAARRWVSSLWNTTLGTNVYVLNDSQFLFELPTRKDAERVLKGDACGGWIEKEEEMILQIICAEHESKSRVMEKQYLEILRWKAMATSLICLFSVKSRRLKKRKMAGEQSLNPLDNNQS